MLRNFDSYDWFTLSLILLCFGFLLLRQYNVVKYLQFIKIGYSDAFWTNKLKESRFVTTFEVILFTLPHLAIAQIIYLFSYDSSAFQSIELYPFLEVLILFLVLCLFSVIKYYVEKFINNALNKSSFLDFYIYYKQIIWTYAIFWGLPFLILSIYLPLKNINFLSISLLIMALFYIFKLTTFIYKNRSIMMSNWYYFILYLCTLEIAPYFFIYKIIVVE